MRICSENSRAEARNGGAVKGRSRAKARNGGAAKMRSAYLGKQTE